MDPRSRRSVETGPVATLFFRRDGVVLGDHTGQIVYDDQRRHFIVAMSSWGDFDFNGVHVRHTITRANILSGVPVLAAERLPLPTTVCSWDPSLTKIDGRWHVAFVESPAQQPAFVFHPALAAGPRGAAYDEGLELVDADTTLDQAEGTILQKVGGSWCLLASDGDARQYLVYDLAVCRLGILDAPYGTNIPHPMIVSVGRSDPPPSRAQPFPGEIRGGGALAQFLIAEDRWPMATPSASDRWREETARRVLDGVHRRVSLGEAIGILRVWRACGEQQARDDLHATHGSGGQDHEVSRVIAVVNASAEGRTDPDARWD